MGKGRQRCHKKKRVRGGSKGLKMSLSKICSMLGRNIPTISIIPLPAGDHRGPQVVLTRKGKTFLFHTFDPSQPD